MPDYLRLARELRAKADYVPPLGSGLQPVGEAERAALLAKAGELEARYRNSSSRSTDQTIPVGAFGFTVNWPTETEVQRQARYAESMRQTWDLYQRQHQWNKEEDIVEEDYQHEPEDEDYGYDLFEDDDW